MKQADVTKLDTNMSVGHIVDHGLQWLEPKDYPQMVFGFPWFEREGRYRRLPEALQYSVPDAVNQLANMTSGGQLRFITDSSCVAIRVTLSGAAGMYHMPATGQCGFDCYMDTVVGMKYWNTVKYESKNASYDFVFFENKERLPRKILLHFPLYQGIEELQIGVDGNATLLSPNPFPSSKRVLFYGTSITQGGCASRPGMSYTNILSRMLGMECYNLGFAGNGRGEPALAKIIADLQQLNLIVLDYEANANVPLDQTLPQFISILRKKHPAIPILVVSKIPFSNELHDPKKKQVREDNAMYQWELVTTLRDSGDQHIHFCNGATLLGSDFEECTVDGVHPTDLGFYQMANGLLPMIQKLVCE